MATITNKNPVVVTPKGRGGASFTFPGRKAAMDKIEELKHYGFKSSLTQEENSRWQAQVRLKDANGELVLNYNLFETKAEAEGWAMDAEAKLRDPIRNGSALSAGQKSMALGEALERYKVEATLGRMGKAETGASQKARSLRLGVQIETRQNLSFRPINHQLTTVFRKDVGTLLIRS